RADRRCFVTLGRPFPGTSCVSSTAGGRGCVGGWGRRFEGRDAMPRLARKAAGGVIGLGAALLFALPGVAAPPSVVSAKSYHGARSWAARAPLTKADARRAEERLAGLGYWVGPVDGVLDPVSRQAVVAFQKIAGRKATGRLTRADLSALDRAVPPLPR